MNIVHAQFNNIKLICGFQFWSNPHMTYETCTYRILEKPMQADDEGLTPIDVDTSVEEIREFLTAKVEELELNIAARMLQQYNASSNS